MRRPADVSRIIGVALLCCAFGALPASPARAQTGPRFGARGFVDIGSQYFTAADTFNAVLETNRGTFIGGGGQFVWQSLQLEVSASRFEDSGQRVFVLDEQVFRLGIPATIGLTALEVTAAYRFAPVWRLRPYAGGGFGRHRYTERSEFAESAEDVSFNKTGYHLAGGAEVQVWRWIRAAGELRHRVLRDAIGEAGASREFGETDLGGTSVAVRLLVGR
jgi:opacity protein-like surface antigen